MLKKIFSTFGHKLLIVLSNFLVVVLTSRILGSEGRGETNLFLTDFSIIYLCSGIIGGTTISFFLSKKDPFTMVVLGYLWSFLMCFLLTPLLAIIHPNNFSFWLFGISLFQSLTMANQMILLGRNDLNSYNINTAIQPVIHLFFLVFSNYYLEKLSVELFIKSFFFSSLLAFLVSLIQNNKHINSYRLSETQQTFKDMLAYGAKSNYDNIFETLNYRAGIYFLFWFGFQHAVGELSNSIALAEGTWLISNSLSLVLYAHCLQSENLIEQQKLTLAYTKICIGTTFVALSFMVIVPQDFYLILFGNDFPDIIFYIILLFPGVVFLGASNILGHYLAAKGDYKANNIKSTIGFVSVIILLFILIPLLGKKGAALATSISYAVSSFYLFYYYFKQTKTPISKLLEWADLKELWTKRKEINS